MTPRPYGNNDLVTGASSGIGLACLLLFCERGYRVWGVSRSASASQPLPPNARLQAMDVTDDASVAETVRHIWMEATEETGEGIGTVIHCAGYGIAGSAEDTSLEHVKAQFETNYFGVLRVNQALLPLMRERGKAMVIVLGSIAGRISIPFQSHYSASKFAIEATSRHCASKDGRSASGPRLVEAGDTKTVLPTNVAWALPSDSPTACRHVTPWPV